MRVPWTARRWNQSILKEMNPEYSLEKLMLKLKLQYFDRLMERKDPDAGKDWGREEKEATEDEMVGWHHGLNGWESEQTQGNSEGQGSLHAAVHGVAKSWTWLSDWTVRTVENGCVGRQAQCRRTSGLPISENLWEGRGCSGWRKEH